MFLCYLADCPKYWFMNYPELPPQLFHLDASVSGTLVQGVVLSLICSFTLLPWSAS
jgi:hypothetical protein